MTSHRFLLLGIWCTTILILKAGEIKHSFTCLYYGSCPWRWDRLHAHTYTHTAIPLLCGHNVAQWGAAINELPVEKGAGCKLKGFPVNINQCYSVHKRGYPLSDKRRDRATNSWKIKIQLYKLIHSSTIYDRIYFKLKDYYLLVKTSFIIFRSSKKFTGGEDI